MGTNQFLDEGLVKNRRPGLQPLKEGAYPFDMFPLKHPCLKRCTVAVIRKHIPSAEDQIGQVGQGNKIPYSWNSVLKPLTQTYGPHLGQGADRDGLTLPNHLHSR